MIIKLTLAAALSGFLLQPQATSPQPAPVNHIQVTIPGTQLQGSANTIQTTIPGSYLQ